MTLDSVSRHADQVTGLQALGLRASRRAWRRVSVDDISASWAQAQVAFRPALEALQYRAAVTGSEYVVSALAEQGMYEAPQAFVDPRAFVGRGSTGRPLQGVLDSPVIAAKQAVAAGKDPVSAVAAGGSRLETLIRSALADAARQAASVDIAARPNTGYTRQLVGTSCPDCVILAGRFYRWNAGFLRHPGDDCVHVPTTQAAASSVLMDPYQHFAAMSEQEQDEFWGAGDAQAIRDGGDIYRVYNARRGAAKDRLTTTEGASKRRGFAVDGRLTPDGIYAQAKSREQALRLLEIHGYVLPGRQTPGGSIRGQREGYGALSRGGTRIGARQTVERARSTGERSGSRYAMTAAERKLNDATARWEEARNGRNPYTLGGGGLTPKIAARVETDYRRWLRTGGEVFTK